MTGLFRKGKDSDSTFHKKRQNIKMPSIFLEYFSNLLIDFGITTYFSKILLIDAFRIALDAYLKLDCPKRFFE